MKRITTPAFLVCAFTTFTACTDTKTIKDFEAYCQTIDSTTIVLKRVNNIEEFQKITSEFANTSRKFYEEHKDAEVAEELTQQVKIASNAYIENAKAKVKELKSKNSK